MPLQHLCAECLAAGVQAEPGFSADYLVYCSFCGKVDEAATVSRSTVDETAQFGSLMNEHGVSVVQFDEYREKQHEVRALSVRVEADQRRTLSTGSSTRTS